MLIAVGVWLTVRAISAGSVSDAWNAPGGTGLSFWVGVDLVIAMPVSWLPLAADYSRFTPAPRSAFAGTYVGYALGNAWFYSLGAVLVVVAGAGVSVLGIGAAMIALGGGVAVLLALLVGETDGAFANVYSTATSIRTIAPWLPGRTTTLLVGAVAFVLAALVGTSAETFELFLLTVGSVFVPLFGVFFAFEAAGRPAAVRGADPGAIGAWAAGFAVFQWSSPSPLPAWSSGVRWLFADVAHLPFPLFDGALGASIPSALVAGAIGWIVFLRRRRQVSREPRRAGAR